MEVSKQVDFQHEKVFVQTLANRGHNSTFVDEASSTRSSPKPSSSRVIKLMDPTQVTQPGGESQVKSTLIISHFRVLRQVIKAKFEVIF